MIRFGKEVWILPFVLTLWIVAICVERSFSRRYKIIEDERFRNPISSKVVKSKSYHGRSIEIHLDNKFTFYFTTSFVKAGAIKVGDSIHKNANTFKYRIFRKNSDGRFVEIGEYDMRRHY